MWTLSPRPPSKTTETPTAPLSTPTKSLSPPKPPAPRSDGKPPQPYPAPPDQYWRWNTKTAGSLPDDELVEAVRYVMEILRSNGIDDPAAFVGEVDSLTLKEARRARRLQRLAAFK